MIYTDTVQADLACETDSLQDQEAAKLIATLVAARLVADRSLERETSRRLERDYSIRLMFADDLATKEANHE
jgi:HAMP domain-containing protein